MSILLEFPPSYSSLMFDLLYSILLQFAGIELAVSISFAPSQTFSLSHFDDHLSCCYIFRFVCRQASTRYKLISNHYIGQKCSYVQPVNVMDRRGSGAVPRLVASTEIVAHT